MSNVSQIVEVQEVEAVVPILLLIYFYPKFFGWSKLACVSIQEVLTADASVLQYVTSFNPTVFSHCCLFTESAGNQCIDTPLPLAFVRPHTTYVHFRYLVRPIPWMANPLWSTLTFRFRGWRQIHETDKGSKPHLACLIVQGVPADGVIDTGADIVIMGKELFARVAATERLHKKSLGSQTECHGLMTERDSSGWVHGHGSILCW